MDEGLPPPQWSVVIVSFDAGELLDRCVASVRADAPGGTEVILVDNASSDGSAQRVALRFGVRLVSNNRNVGFPQAINQGLELASGELVLLLNPDAMLPIGFFDAALAGIGPNGAFDLISAAQQGDPELQDTTGAMLTTREILRQLLLRRRGAARFGPVTRTDEQEFRRLMAGYLSGYCLAASRATFQRLGGFDPGLFWSEDVDLSARAMESGLVLGVCTSTEVVHEQTHTRRRYVALVTFFQLTAKIGYARRHAPRSVSLVAAVVALTAALRFAWFGIAKRRAPDARAKALAYRSVMAHVMRRSWRLPDGWDPCVVDRLRASAVAP